MDYSPNSHSNFPSRKPLYRMEYEIETLESMFVFLDKVDEELTSKELNYESTLYIGPTTFIIKYKVYG
jgi:hypothetical protein